MRWQATTPVLSVATPTAPWAMSGTMWSPGTSLTHSNTLVNYVETYSEQRPSTTTIWLELIRNKVHINVFHSLCGTFPPQTQRKHWNAMWEKTKSKMFIIVEFVANSQTRAQQTWGTMLRPSTSLICSLIVVSFVKRHLARKLRYTTTGGTCIQNKCFEFTEIN